MRRKRNKVKVKCAYCGKPKEVWPCVAGKHNFCSNECVNKWQSKKVKAKCSYCGEIKERPLSQVHKHNFCNKECEGKWRSKKIKVKCDYCGEIIERIPAKVSKANFCDNECKYKYFSGEKYSGGNSPSWQGGKSFEPYGLDFTRALKKAVRVRDDYTCQLCEVKWKKGQSGFCIHHIDYNKQNCELSDLITLCRSCNTKVNFDRAYWTKYFRMLMDHNLRLVVDK